MEQLLSYNEVLVKKLEIVPVECVIRNRDAGLLVKRALASKKARLLALLLFDMFLKNNTMRKPMINESYCEYFWLSKQRTSSALARAEPQSK
jgi:phosphoribosylaminoimidazole-succinocarboxamide synthase